MKTESSTIDALPAGESEERRGNGDRPFYRDSGGSLRRFWFRLVSALKAGLFRAGMLASNLGQFITDASDRLVLDSLRYLREHRRVRAALRNSKRLILAAVVTASVVVVVRESLVVINYDYDGVVVRLGKYDRTMSPGVNFMIPVIEQLYVVNTEDRRQEHFGFVQFTPPAPPRTERELLIRQEENELLQMHEQAEQELANSGNLTHEFGRSPSLTRSHLVEANVEPLEPIDPAEQEDEVIERMEVRQKSVENIVPASGKVPVPEEMKMITGDLGIVYLTYSVQYEIVSAERYLFNSVDVRRNLRDLSQVALRVAVGDRSTSGVLSDQRAQVEAEANSFLQTEVDRYKLGLKINSVIIQDANPPDQVRAAFNQVNAAKQAMENTIHLAEAEYNSTLPQMLGKADRLIAEARAYETELTNKAEGEARRFEFVLREYERDPEVIRTRYFIETQEDLHARMNITLIDPALKGILPIYSNHARHEQAASADQPVGGEAMLGSFATPQFETVAGQHVVKEPVTPASGPHNVLPHYSDPLGVDPVEQAVTTPPQSAPVAGLTGQQSVHIAPAATEVRPAHISNPEVKP